MAKNYNEWQQPLVDLEEGIRKLEDYAKREVDAVKRTQIEKDIAEFRRRHEAAVEAIYSRLDPWEKVLVARAPKRPYTLDYVNTIFQDFVELEGDRRFKADQAIVGGPASLDGQAVIIVGHQKGRTIQERQTRNFGYARPEGYRKAIRLFEMAERFRLPVITFVDTPGADAGVEAESRGISEAIAASMLKMFELTVPSISIIIGEGGSGGAIGIACSNRVLMLEHSIYSVIAPEGCAAILWRMPERGEEAAKALRLTAQSALEFNLIDGIIPEPKGGADRQPIITAMAIKDALHTGLKELKKVKNLREQRYQKFRSMGIFEG